MPPAKQSKTIASHDHLTMGMGCFDADFAFLKAPGAA
jgi:hypothetical protein